MSNKIKILIFTTFQQPYSAISFFQLESRKKWARSNITLSCLKYYVRQYILKNLSSRSSVVNFYELKSYSKLYHIFVTWNRTSLGSYNPKFPLFWTVKLYAAYRYMSNNVHGVTVLQRYVSNLFYSVSKF